MRRVLLVLILFFSNEAVGQKVAVLESLIKKENSYDDVKELYIDLALIKEYNEEKLNAVLAKLPRITSLIVVSSSEDVQKVWVNKSVLQGVDTLKVSLRSNLLNDCIRKLKGSESIKKLMIYESDIAKLPDAIGDFKSIEELVVNETKIQGLPLSITTLGNLKKIDLSTNPYLVWDKCYKSLLGLPQLNWLSFRRCNLDSFPSGIWRIRDLVYLDLAQNRISNVPPELCNLKLKVLDLGLTEVSTLPACFLGMESLEYLNLWRTNVSTDFIQKMKDRIPELKVAYFKPHKNR